MYSEIGRLKSSSKPRQMPVNKPERCTLFNPLWSLKSCTICFGSLDINHHFANGLCYTLLSAALGYNNVQTGYTSKQCLPLRCKKRLSNARNGQQKLKNSYIIMAMVHRIMLPYY